MERTAVNPWQWSMNFGFNQGELVDGANRVLFCSGQTSVDADGAPQHPGDMRAQLSLALDNLEAVLRDGGMGLGNVVRLNFYTTDVDAYLASSAVLRERLGAAGAMPAGTLLGVARLAFPELMVEIEGTAVA
jgi:enamine deaminase RidA (YjgF/YER057c/UK114 family)